MKKWVDKIKKAVNKETNNLDNLDKLGYLIYILSQILNEKQNLETVTNTLPILNFDFYENIFGLFLYDRYMRNFLATIAFNEMKRDTVKKVC